LSRGAIKAVASIGRRSGKVIRALCSDRRRRALRAGVVASRNHEQLVAILEPVLVIDVGANGGQFALATLEASTEARIVSFEPLAAPCERFMRAIDDRRVALRAIALGSKSGEATINVSRADDSSSILEITDLQDRLFPGTARVGTEVVAVSTLDAEFDDVPPRTLLKIDVQGYELEVLRGGARLLGSIDWVLCEVSFLELYAGQPAASDVIECLREHGLRLTGVPHLTSRGARTVQADLLFGRADR
jgi:FkbM family methyltransferase